MYDVVGIGNPLLDIVVSVGDDVLDQFSFAKAGMHLVDKDYYEKMQELFADLQKDLAPGGSCANTIATASLLGGNNAYFGVVGKDKEGVEYDALLKEAGVTSLLSKDELPTGVCTVMVTPDKERTFATYLGASCNLKHEHIDVEAIKKAKILHFVGYQFDTPHQAENAFLCAQIAKENGVLVSFDVADPGVLERSFDHVKKMVALADIVFFNEDEAKAFTGSDALAVFDMVNCKYTIVKLGSKGSVVRAYQDKLTIDPYAVDVVNTVGAGDAYAAGFLFALAKDFDLEKCGKIASFVAAQTVAVVGPRAGKEILDGLKKEGLL